MNRLLLSFVPYNVVQDLVKHPGESPVGRDQRFEAVALFADVSGFTAISEALGKTGKQGTEELTRILNSYFEPMIDLIQSYGGIIGKFGGDAMTALFPYTRRRSQAATVRRAIQCALDMQSQMHHYASIPTPAGVYSLAMKAGLSMGTVLCTSVGDPAIRLEYLIAGELLDVCAEAEHHASKGEVVIHKSLQPLAGDLIIIEERHDFLCVEALVRRASRQPLKEANFETEVPEFVASFLHPLLVERLNQGRSGFINEHRKVTVLFVSFRNFDYDHDPQVSAKLQTFLSDVIRIINQYDGYLNKVDMGDKGSKFIVLFGAPVAHENDEERALQCALDLIGSDSDESEPPTPLRIGVNTGFVYCGQVGSALRQEYTVMGDAVNLSARMMQASKPNQILVSGFTRHYVVDKFGWESFTPIFVKGKSEPIPIFAVQDFKSQGSLHLQEPSYALPIVGRKQELQDIEGYLETALQGKGQIIGITAEAGMGKSRLAAEIIKLAGQKGLGGYGGECQSYGSETPYLAWRNLWRGFFGLEPEWTVEQQIARLEAQLAEIEPGLVPRMPLLAPVLNLAIPENELIRSLEPQMQKASREALLVTCLRAQSRADSSHSAGHPLLLVLEDCHWIDQLSIDLLETVVHSLNDLPVLLLLLYRPPENEKDLQLGTSWPARLNKFKRFGYFKQFLLEKFGPEEVEQLIALKLRQLFPVDEEGKRRISLPVALLERIINKAEGNPFYIDEMLNLIHDRKIELEDEAALERLELPDSLYSLIISRIDQLHEDEKIALKVASVIGRLFKAAWLWGVYPELGAPAQVRHRLESLSQLELTPLDKPEPELEYLFKHVVTQQVAYESLAGATRTTLHEQTGHFIEQAYPEKLDTYLAELAFHYGRSQNQDKQRLYFRKAGEVAQATYANQTAVDFYRRLLPLLPGPEQPAVLLKLGEVLQTVGNKAEEETAYREAMKQAQLARDEVAEAQSRIYLGFLMYRKGLHNEAFELLYQALEKGRELDNKLLISHSLGNIGIVYQQQGQYDRALSCHEQHLQIVTELGDPSAMHKAFGNIGIVYYRQGDYDQALAYNTRQLQIASEIGDRPGISKAAGNIGNIYYEQGDYFKALEYYGQLLRIAVEIGYRLGICDATGSIGNFYYQQGEYSQALACYLQMLQLALELGEKQRSAIALANMAEVYVLQRRLDEANKIYPLAIRVCREIKFLRILSGSLYDYAKLEVQQKHFREALFLNTEALQLATQIRYKDMEFKAQVLAIILRTKLDENKPTIGNAISEFEEMLGKWLGEEQQAALHYEIWKLAKTEKQHCQASANFYRALYLKTPNFEYSQRYKELTGETLAAPPALPVLPELQIQATFELDSLLSRLETII